MFGLRDIDRTLRGEFRDDIGSIRLPSLLFANLLLAALYGICMGFFGLFARGSEWEYRQMIACVVKVPALFLLTFLVTFPSLYVFNTLFGSRQSLGHLARLVTAAAGVLLAVLAGLGPIVAFFSVTTINYPFAVLMNVAAFAFAGALGLLNLFKTLRYLAGKAKVAAVVEDEGGEVQVPLVSSEPTIDMTKSRGVFLLWIVLVVLVGMQMSWVLRPFIGSPDMPFAWFRDRTGSFAEAVGKALRLAFGAGQ